MSIFDTLGGKQANRQTNTPANALQQLRQNPVGMLQQAGFSIPNGMSNPQQIVQHLLQSGQVPQQRYAQAMQYMAKMRGRVV